MKKFVLPFAALALCAAVISCEKNPQEKEDPNLVKFTEPANSFIVSPGAKVLFPTCKGNSGEYVQVSDLALGWQDNKELFAEVVAHTDKDATISFAEGEEGNATVNGLDAEGNVLWSWHFWVVKDTPKDVTVGTSTFMDRNIGAINLDEKSDLSVGVTYQYGRKDPFPSMKFGEYALKKAYGADGAEVEMSIKECTEADNLANTILNPFTFYSNKYVSGAKHGYSWITTDATTFDVAKFKSFWMNEGKKSMYDPCPAGYKVAAIEDWNNAKAEDVTVEEFWDNDYVTFDESAIGTYEKYIAGNKKKVQFRGCAYNGLRLTITGEVCSNNSYTLDFNNCIGKPLPSASVWCADIDPEFEANQSTSNGPSYFRGTVTKVNTTGNGNGEDISAIKVNPISVGSKYTLKYAYPVRCVREK